MLSTATDGEESEPAPQSLHADTMTTELKEYTISVEWTAYGYMHIEAASLQDAVDQACDQAPLPTEWDYLDGSFRIDVEDLRRTYPDEQEEIRVPEECAG